MEAKDLIHQTDALLDEHVRKPNQSRVSAALIEQKTPEVLVDGDQNAAIRHGSPEDLLVSGIGPPLAGFNGTMPLFPEPFREAPAGTAVDQEFQ